MYLDNNFEELEKRVKEFLDKCFKIKYESLQEEEELAKPHSLQAGAEL